MADFCKQCEPELDNMKGLTTVEEYQKGLACAVICEGCGLILVDPDGNCLTDCLEHHKVQLT